MDKLYNEIFYKLRENGKTINDIKYICTVQDGENVEIDKDEFFDLARNIDFSTYGCDDIDKELKIVGADFWIEVDMYDGEKWLGYRTMPERPREIATRYKRYYPKNTGFDFW